MPNTILTIDMITKEALRVLHQESVLIKRVRRDYDDRFARSGAKIGDNLRIRKPAKYRSTTGKTLQVQDSQEQFSNLPVRNQRGVHMSFGSAEMSLDIDSYSRQFIRPAMAQLAADIEAEFSTFVRNRTFWTVGGAAANFASLAPALFAGQRLDQQLSPRQRDLVLNPVANATLVNGLTTLFHSGREIANQYEDGMMGRAAGFDFYMSSLLPVQLNNTSVLNGTVNGANQTGSSVVLAAMGNNQNIPAGTVLTLPGVNAVHPESKVDLGYPQQFVVTADTLTSGAGAVTLPISPDIVTTGAFQNVTASPTASAAVSIFERTTASYGLSYALHQDAFAFATADLDLPPNVEASRQQMDGLSLRALRDYDVVNDASIIRIDCLYGYTDLYPQLAVKIANAPVPV